MYTLSLIFVIVFSELLTPIILEENKWSFAVISILRYRLLVNALYIWSSNVTYQQEATSVLGYYLHASLHCCAADKRIFVQAVSVQLMLSFSSP